MNQVAATAVAPPPNSSLTHAISALTALVVPMENATAPSLATAVFNDDIRRKGQEAATADGSEAMDAILQIARDAAPDRAERREALIGAAWAGLPGWRSEERQP